MPLFNELQRVRPADNETLAIATYGNALSHARSSIRSAIADEQRRIEEIGSLDRSLAAIVDHQQKRLDELLAMYGGPAGESPVAGLPSAELTVWLAGGVGGVWKLAPAIALGWDSDYQAAYAALRQASGKKFGGGLRRQAEAAIGRSMTRLHSLSVLRSQLHQRLAQITAETARVVAERSIGAEAELLQAKAVAEKALASAPLAEQPWGNSAWQDWNSLEPELPTKLYLGELAPLDDPELGNARGLGAAVRLPLLVPACSNLVIYVHAGTRERGNALARSTALRLLASSTPGKLQINVYDPVGLGQSARSLLDLAEYDPSLIGGKVWSRDEDLKVVLRELSRHIELVVQKYLRNTYETIDDFNRAAGEVSEARRVLMLFDVPKGLTEETTRLLQTVLENGPRCGVTTLMVLDETAAVPMGVRLSDLNLATTESIITLGEPILQTDNGYTVSLGFVPDSDVSTPAAEMSRSIIETIGRRSLDHRDTPITIDKTFSLFRELAGRGLRRSIPQEAATVDPRDATTWWSVRSASGLASPIGQKGATDVAVLTFDSSEHAGALLVGRPGSGKTTLMHSYIAGLCMMYSPEELELYLIDFKEGVEFKAYAELGLPHARVVAVESDREFGLSVLQSVSHEIVRRGEILRSTGGRFSGIEGLRAATAERMPRALLIFDEFQVLFATADETGREAARLLESIIRQGRGFGVHVLLGSQTLAGMEALGSHVPNLLPTRVLLAASREDNVQVLGERNDGGLSLTKSGDGILNPAGGAPEANERFNASMLGEEERTVFVRQQRAKADQSGFTRRPDVFEGNLAPALDLIEPRLFREELASAESGPIRLRMAKPMASGSVGDVILRREQAANVLVIARNDPKPGIASIDSDGAAYAMLISAIASALQSQALVDLVSLTPADDGLVEKLEPMKTNPRLRVHSRREVGHLMDQLSAEVQSRLETGTGGGLRILFIFGIHRVRELDSSYGVGADLKVTEDLNVVLRAGPDVGIHLWAWADSLAGVDRRLQSHEIREFGWRILGPMSQDDSLALLRNDHAELLRSGQVLVVNTNTNTETKALAFAAPSPSWLSEVAQN